MPSPGRFLLLPLLLLVALLSSQCATPTALTLTIYTDVPCSKTASVTLIGGSSLGGLANVAPAAVTSMCSGSGRVGSIVIVPAGAKDQTIAFAVMQRPDGDSSEMCLATGQSDGCIVAKRQFRFESHEESEMRVDLRLSCLGVLCPADQTCVKGACFSADVGTCSGSCDESTLVSGADTLDAGTPDTGAPDVHAPDAGDASPSTGLLGLTTSAGPLSPMFDPATLTYSVVPSVVSLGVPLTVTPTYAVGSVAVNGVTVPSGVASAAIPLTVRSPRTLTITFTPPPSLGGAPIRYAITVPAVEEAYAKASNSRANSKFGFSMALSGNTLAVGAPFESSNATGINGNQADTSTPGAGAVYVFTRTGSAWTQEAYLKASNTRVDAAFGCSLALDGDTLVVGSCGETGAASGINGNQAAALDTPSAGAAYVFTRTGTTWSQQAYVKASNTRSNAQFGYQVALSGNTLAVSAFWESSNATGINGNQSDTSAPFAGAVYVFTRSGTTWSQQAYVKASNTRTDADFGNSLGLSGDTLAVGSFTESSNATGINGNQANTSASGAGAAYVFVRTGTTWSQQAYVKASNTLPSNFFGGSLAVSGDTLAVGSFGESGSATGVNGDDSVATMPSAGAAYVFTRTGTTWSQQAYVKASNTCVTCSFGEALALDGDLLAVGAQQEPSAAVGINGNQSDTSAAFAGAVYLFGRSGTTWEQTAYVKASSSRSNNFFGSAVALSADTLASAAFGESSNATGINGSEGNTSAASSGAVYVLR